MKNTLLFLIAFPLTVFAQTQYKSDMSDSAFIRMIANNILTSRASYNNLHHLTKNIGGRLAGSPQMVMAEQWGDKALQQAGADTVWLQQAMVPHWIRGGKDKASITYKDEKGNKKTADIAVLAIGNSVGTGAKGVAAPLIRVKSFDDLEQHRDELKGKIVFYDVPFEDTFVQTFMAYGKNVIYRGQGASRAAKYGAVAVLVRSMSNSMDNYPHTGTLHYTESLPKIPAASVGLRDVEKLDSLFDEGKFINASLFTYGELLPDTIGHNVIGELKAMRNSNVFFIFNK